MQLKFCEYELNKDGLATLSLNRPKMRNAFNDEMLLEMTNLLLKESTNQNIRLLFLKGNGLSFCAGADLNWMKKMKDYTLEENIQDSQHLVKFFKALKEFPKPTLGKVHGTAMGGGIGIIACLDHVIALETAKLAFSEVKLGLLPAVISVFCIPKIGYSHAKSLFSSGKIFNGEYAKRINLVHETAATEHELEQKIQEHIDLILSIAPSASSLAKQLVDDVCERIYKNDPSIHDFTVQTIAKKRVDDEAQEGMQALLDKRKPKFS